ncbi:MAG: ERF family protein [Spirochaetia bacterium]|jgi:hypothetical protein|nr:ERF family protein [Spirochaetia bacterium]
MSEKSKIKPEDMPDLFEQGMKMEVVEDEDTQEAVVEDQTQGTEITGTLEQTREISTLSESGQLLQMALDKDKGIDIIERFIELKNKEEGKLCKKEFDLHFSAMQKDYIPATKGNDVYNKEGNKILYKFCSLEDILKVYSPIISKHGFSFKWKEEMMSENLKKISCIISGYGHEEIGSVEIPISAATSFTNSIQQRGVSTSYGKRYSFINSFGVIIEDEDDDAQSLTFDDGVKYAAIVQQIGDCKTIKELSELWTLFWKDPDYDLEDKRRVGTIKDKKKKELTKK